MVILGRAYMMAAFLAHDLSEKKTLSLYTLLHFPSFAIDVKNAISSGLVKRNLNRSGEAEILILDDYRCAWNRSSPG